MSLALCIALTLASGDTHAQASFDNADAYFEDAVTRIADGDTAGGIIQLRNALQLENDHEPSLLALGKALLDSGEPTDAALVLSDALLFGVEPAQVIPVLADAYLRARAFEELLRTLQPDNVPRSLRAEVYAARAQALLAMGRTVEGGTMLKRAKDIDPSNYRTALAEISYLLQQRDMAAADTASAALIERFDSDTRSWSSRASVLHAQGRLSEAAESYESALTREPDNIDARISLIDLLMETGRNAEAAPHIAYLRENFENEPRGAYYSALLAARSGDNLKESEELSKAVTLFGALAEGQLEGNPQMLMLAALASYGSGSYEIAAGYVESFLALQPQDAGALRLKASSLLALGDTSNAIRTLLPQNQRDPRDIATASLLATAYSREGNYKRAEELLLSVSAGGLQSEALEQQLAFARLNAGSLALGIADLERIQQRSPERTDLVVQLSLAYLRNREPQKAIALLDSLPEDLAATAPMQNLRAMALPSLGQRVDAERIWLQILEESPENVDVILNLVTSQLEQGLLQEARSLLDIAQAADADSSMALVMSARLNLRLNDLEGALRDAERATNLDSGNVDATWQLVRALLALERSDEALEVARSFSARRPDSLPAAAILGQTFEFVGRPSQARLVYAQMARMPDLSANDLFRIASLQRDAGAREAAEVSFTFALERDPGFRAARIELASVQLQLEKYAAAEETALAQLTLDGSDPIAWILVGEARWGSGSYDNAIRAFERAIDEGAAAPGSIGIYRSQLEKGNPAAAEAALKRGRGLADDDPRVVAALSDLLIAQGRWTEAEIELNTLLELVPASAPHFNNRAFARQQLGRLDEAEEDARQAIELEPGYAPAHDTLGWILAEAGRPREALPFLREAMARMGSNESVRFHLARVLADLGRKKESLAELYYALESESDYPERADALQLQAELQGM